MRSHLLVPLGLLAAALAAGCGEENRDLIPERRASALTATVDRIGQACADEDVDQAQAAVDEANHQVSELPSRVDPALRDNLRDWLGHIQANLEADCKPPEEQQEETPTPSPTETPTPTPTPTDTPSPSPSPEPEPEPTEPPPSDAPVEPPEEGGVPAPEEGQ